MGAALPRISSDLVEQEIGPALCPQTFWLLRALGIFLQSSLYSWWSLQSLDPPLLSVIIYLSRSSLQEALIILPQCYALKVFVWLLQINLIYEVINMFTKLSSGIQHLHCSAMQCLQWSTNMPKLRLIKSFDIYQFFLFYVESSVYTIIHVCAILIWNVTSATNW